MVANQIEGPVDEFWLNNPYQSVYKAFHSTETAVMPVTDDILNSIGEGQGNVTALTQLDLSAALLIETIGYF